jgi:hypothetical protein
MQLCRPVLKYLEGFALVAVVAAASQDLGPARDETHRTDQPFAAVAAIHQSWAVNSHKNLVLELAGNCAFDFAACKEVAAAELGSSCDVQAGSVRKDLAGIDCRAVAS